VIRAPPFLKEMREATIIMAAVTQCRARADRAAAPLAMLERWFPIKRLGGVRAANLRGTHENRVLFSDTEGGGEGNLHLPGKKYGHAGRGHTSTANKYMTHALQSAGDNSTSRVDLVSQPGMVSGHKDPAAYRVGSRERNSNSETQKGFGRKTRAPGLGPRNRRAWSRNGPRWITA
jgi:hypothetical protein